MKKKRRNEGTSKTLNGAIRRIARDIRANGELSENDMCDLIKYHMSDFLFNKFMVLFGRMGNLDEDCYMKFKPEINRFMKDFKD